MLRKGVFKLNKDDFVESAIKDVKRFKNLISIAAKAGNLHLGFDAAKKVITNHKTKLLLVSNTLSNGTKHAIIRKAQLASVNYKLIPISPENFLEWLGKRVGIIALTDEGFAKGINSLILNKINKEE
ncbi:MAG: hypothetical protein ACI4PI_00725 [Oscillospiraceae bacterium]